MNCCPKMDKLMDRDLVRHSQPHQLSNGTIITDIGLAPKNAAGRGEFSGDFYILKPVDMRKGHGRLLCDVGNRGRKVAPGKLS